MSDNEPKFGELKEVPMREVWAHEAHDFTPWLAKNINALGDALELSLRVKETESSIGAFSLDILAVEEDSERIVAIENQFNPTDHSHLGQLLTYAAGCEADILVWIVEKVRDEHRAAVEWLNRKTDTETHFYLVEVKVLRIGDSLPAYQLVPVVAPNEWQKERRQKTTALTAEDKECAEYFRLFYEAMQEKGFPYIARKQRQTTRTRGYWCVEGVHKWSYSHAFPGDDYWGDVYIQFHYARDWGASPTKLREELMRRAKDIGGGVDIEFDGCKGEWIARISAEKFMAGGEKSQDEIRAWAVDAMFKLAAAIPPSLLQEIEEATANENGE